MTQAIQSRLDSEIDNARQTFDILRNILRSAESMVDHGFFSDAYKIHQFAVYLLESQSRIQSLREVLKTLREEEISATAEQPEVACA